VHTRDRRVVNTLHPSLMDVCALDFLPFLAVVVPGGLFFLAARGAVGCCDSGFGVMLSAAAFAASISSPAENPFSELGDPNKLVGAGSASGLAAASVSISSSELARRSNSPGDSMTRDPSTLRGEDRLGDGISKFRSRNENSGFEIDVD